MERPITNQSHWQTDRQKRQISLGTEEKEGEGWGGGRMANAFTRPDRGINMTSPLPERHHIRPHQGAWGSRTRRGRMWEVGWGGSELSPGLTPASMGSGWWVNGMRADLVWPDRALKSNFPDFLREPGDESPGKNGINKMAEQRCGFNQTGFLLLDLHLKKISYPSQLLKYKKVADNNTKNYL